jgi:FkbH-like protein
MKKNKTKQEIFFSGSFFLMSNSNSWNRLKKKYKLKFNNYRFYDQILNNESDYNVIILNFKDLISYPIHDISLSNQKKITNNISKIFNIIKKKLTTNKKLILFQDFYYGETSIKASQNFPIEEKIIFYIKKRIQKLFKYPNFFYFDINSFFQKNFFDNRLFYINRGRYSESGLKYISKKIEKTIERIKNSTKKVLVLDCDNTLWGGVVGEDGVHNIKIGTDGEGAVYSDFQKSILRLKNEGVVLCIASKNNLNDILEVFKKNTNMILKKNDFTLIKSDWKEKSRNIVDISNELDLSLNSFVFFDDNPLERLKVKNNLKDVKVIEPNNDISFWPQQLLENFYFTKFKIIKEDLLKTEQYKNRAKFLTEKKKFVNQSNFLSSLKIKAKIVKIDINNELRCLQIINKTNQFNLTSKRYDLKEIRDIKKNKKKIIFMVDLSDRFGDHGLVAFVMLNINKDFCHIENIAMSCRVLSRNLENWIISKIILIAKKNKLEKIVGEYVPSKKNIIVKNFYSNLGFNKIIESTDIPKNAIKHSSKKSEFFLQKIEKINLIKNNLYNEQY